MCVDENFRDYLLRDCKDQLKLAIGSAEYALGITEALPITMPALAALDAVDSTKSGMTNAELVKQVKAFAPATGAEVERRLERLERCERTLRKYTRCQHGYSESRECPNCFCTDAARAALEE